MYAISNNNKAEIAKLLEFSGNIPGDDLKTVNVRRRAKLVIDMLNKAKPIDADSVKKANTDYTEFLKSKIQANVQSGFDIETEQLNPALFDFQKHCVRKALSSGRFALFEDCGLGKTVQQLEWCSQIAKRENAPVLILAPLAVTGQTLEEAARFGYDAERLNTDSMQLHPKTYITNYEKLDSTDAGLFAGIALDESSILKNFEGKMRNLIIDRFRGTRYKSCWTATPSPNDPMELGNHAEFLGVMGRNEMLSMYFVHDGGDTSKWRLKGHAEDRFWQWVSSWAIMINRPSDIEFSDDGYILPELNMIRHFIETERRNNGMLFNDVAVNATNFNRELRLTADERMRCAAETANSSGDNFIIWIKQDAEGDHLRRLIPGAVEVRGSDRPDIKESRLLGFARNEFRVLITKPRIAQYGLNYQNCHNQIFASLDFSFESLYQALRRSLRFGQKRAVNIHIIITDTMQNVIRSIQTKREHHARMQQAMVSAMKHIQNSAIKTNRTAIDIQLPKFIKTV
jgi:hypothetical protein